MDVKSLYRKMAKLRRQERAFVYSKTECGQWIRAELPPTGFFPVAIMKARREAHVEMCPRCKYS